MPRDGSGVYSKPAGTTAVTDTPIESAKYNSTIDDLVIDANTPRTVAGGGTGVSSYGALRTALGLDIGSNVQAYDATLTSVSALGTASGRMIYTTGIDVWAEAVITAAGRALLDDADSTAQLATLGAAPLASPALTGNPTAPTQTAGNNSTLLATTAFVSAAVASSGAYYTAFTISGTWTKPAGFSADDIFLVEGWGGGGGGTTSNAGGGGGGYAGRRLRYADLPSSVTVTIGAGGAPGSAAGAGGTTSFGSLVTAYGGGGGAAFSAGAGGSIHGVGGNGTSTSVQSLAVGTDAGSGGGGSGADVSGIYGVHWGGGGGAGSASGAQPGGSVFGGGGGASNFSSAGGVSIFGGNGGNNSVGVAPGGGGSRNFAGARGEVRVSKL